MDYIYKDVVLRDESSLYPSMGETKEEYAERTLRVFGEDLSDYVFDKEN